MEDIRLYQVTYLPIAYKDIKKAIIYISDELAAPDAAKRLLEEMESKIVALREYPYMYPIWKENNLKDEVRWMPVSNYMLFYVVNKDIIEIRRFIYKKRNFQNKI